MKKQTLARITAFITTAAIGVTTFSSVFAEESAVTTNNTEKTLAQVVEAEYALHSKGELTQQQCKYATLQEKEIPELLTMEQAKEKKHVKRLYEQETEDNVVIFQNEDGTKSMYSYSFPVKYTDETGKKKDKSAKVVSFKNKKKDSSLTGYQYQNEANDVATYFPEKISKEKGIKLQCKNIRLELIPEQAAREIDIKEKTEKTISSPQTDAVAAFNNVFQDITTVNLENTSILQNPAEAVVEAEFVNGEKTKLTNIKKSRENQKAIKGKNPKANGKNKDTVNYEDVFGEQTKLVYKPTLMGVKEEIVLESYTGHNTFIFTLKTGGLKLVNENGTWILEDEQGINVGSLGQIITFDSTPGEGQKETIGEINAQVIEENQTYRLLVSVSEEFLTDPTTTYPVIIDPAMDVNSNTQMIVQDTSIYTGTSSANGGDTAFYVGNFDMYDSMRKARGLVRFAYLKDSSVARATLNGYIIPDSVQMIITGQAGPGITDNIKAYYPPTDELYSWDEYSATYSSTLWNSYTSFIGSNTYGTNKHMSYNITSLFSLWISGAVNLDSGVQIRSDGEGVRGRGVAIHSREASDYTNRPYIYIEYHNNDDWWQGVHITPTPHEVQHQPYWCWNASARMIARTMTAGALASQETIAANMGKGPNSGANCYETADAINKYMGYPEYYKGVEYRLKEQELIDYINKDFPLAILRMPSSGTVGHFYVIFGYRYNSNNNKFYFMVNDPFSPSLGQSCRWTFQLTYEQLCYESGQKYPNWTDTVCRNW